jgi:hypothetical protein
MCSIRNWSGPTGQPARYVDGTSAAVIVATVPVNAGIVGVTGAVVVGVTGTTVVVVDVAGVVDDAVAAVTFGGVVVALDRRTTARPGDEEPHAPVARTINTANTRTRGRGSTGS